MPAGFRTKNTYTTPTGVTVVRDKTGRAKKAYGKGKAPKGLTKVAEPTASTSPTVTVSPEGTVSTSGFRSQKAARRAVRQQEARSQVVRRITQETKARAQKRSEVKAPKPYEAPKVESKPLKVVPPPRISSATGANPATAVMSSVPGKGPKVTQQRTVKVSQRKQAVRQELRQAKKAVRKSRKPARLTSPIVQTPEQRKIARTVLRVGEKVGASRKEKLAALTTGLQETGFRNLNPGENSTGEDAAGWRQELGAYYSDRQNVAKAAKRFYQEAKTDPPIPGGKGERPGVLAQTIQASAYPTEFIPHEGEARSLLKQFNQGKADPKAVKNLKAVEAEAKALGMKVGKDLGKPPKKVVTRMKAAQKAAAFVDKLKLPYVWGGGHNAGEVNLGSGVDCSGAVSYVLQKMGVELPGGVVSGEMGSYLKPGPGAVTVFYNPDHTFMKVGNRYFGTSGTNPGGGAGFIDKSVGDAEVAKGTYQVGHVPGLGRKVALQLGIPANQNFPGISFSSGGTTATITSGTTRESPGFSSKPIKASPLERAEEANQKLKDLGVAPVGARKARKTSTAVLSELAEKYGVAA